VRAEGSQTTMGKLWTYQDCLRANEETVPSHWPKGVTPTRRRVAWLPPDWGQGNKLSRNGKFVQCYIAPCGRLFYNKPELERFLGRILEYGTKTLSRFTGPVTVDDPPQWPDWLPTEGWHVAHRRLESGRILRIYITPDGSRFFWHKHQVDDFLAGARAPRGEPVGELVSELHDESVAHSSYGVVDVTPLPKRRRKDEGTAHGPSPRSGQAKEKAPSAKTILTGEGMGHQPSLGGGEAKGKALAVQPTPEDGSVEHQPSLGCGQKEAPSAQRGILSALGARVVKTAVVDCEAEDDVAVVDPYDPFGSVAVSDPYNCDFVEGEVEVAEAETPLEAATPVEAKSDLSAEQRAAEAEERAAALERKLRLLQGVLNENQRAALALGADADTAAPIAERAVPPDGHQAGDEPEDVDLCLSGEDTPSAAVVAGTPTKWSVADFFAFLQCQLKMEAEELMHHDVMLKDAAALHMWPSYMRRHKANRRNARQWTPFHMVLGASELFVVRHIYHAEVECWTPYRRFVSMMIFRSTCKGHLFTNVLLKHLQTEAFWEDPKANFAQGSTIHGDLRQYRKDGHTVQSSFCLVPDRFAEDDDEKAITRFLRRAETLIDLAATLWPIVTSQALDPDSRLKQITTKIGMVKCLGEPWVKLLTGCINVVHPELRLLAGWCDTGRCALESRRLMLEAEDALTREKVERSRKRDLPKKDFDKLVDLVNKSDAPSCLSFWQLLESVEAHARKHFKDLPLVVAQVQTPLRQLDAGTLQAQISEYRHFIKQKDRSSQVDVWTRRMAAVGHRAAFA